MTRLMTLAALCLFSLASPLFAGDQPTTAPVRFYFFQPNAPFLRMLPKATVPIRLNSDRAIPIPLATPSDHMVVEKLEDPHGILAIPINLDFGLEHGD